jgi:tetratricopeptide (TPR) repeat protein
VDKFPHDTDFELFLGQWYLVQKRNGEAKTAILSAFRMRPLSPQVHVAVASFSACTGNESAARHFFSSTSASHYVPDNTTKFLVARLLGLPDQEAAVSLINLTLGHSPQLASLYLNLMTLYGYEPLMLKPLVPEQPMVMLALGDLLLSEGHNEEAENAYWSAVYNMDRDATRDEALFYRISSYFAESERLSEALIAVREGLTNYPKSTSLKGLLADLHVRSSHEGH